MIKKIKNFIRNPADKQQLNSLKNQVAKSQLANGRLQADINLLFKKEEILRNIQLAEFQVFSQWGDDGIINFLINYLDIDSKTFIEFGVESYQECNTRFLLMNDNWRGLIMDGSNDNMRRVQQEDLYWKYDLKAVPAFVTKENINSLILDNGFSGELGLLHIDIDGNDYWIWDCIDVVNPVIVIVEYNSVFGPVNPWTVIYDPAFIRNNKHFSNLYFGASITSFCDLGKKKGYSFIGCNSNGNNAYFIRNDKIKSLVVKTEEEGYTESRFSESRSPNGELTFLRGQDRLNVMKGMDVYNTRTKALEKI